MGRTIRPGFGAVIAAALLFVSGCPTLSQLNAISGSDSGGTSADTINLPASTPPPTRTATPTPAPSPTPTATASSGTGGTGGTGGGTTTPTPTPVPTFALSIASPQPSSIYMADTALNSRGEYLDPIPPSASDSARMQSDLRRNGASIGGPVAWSILSRPSTVSVWFSLPTGTGSTMTASSSVVTIGRFTGAMERPYRFAITVQAATAGVSATRSVLVDTTGTLTVGIE